jgi:crotonobetaine/carnitine-CoA ligase
VIWDQFSTSECWDRIDRYEATTTTLISVMIPWLMNKPRSEDDHRNTLSKVRMAPIPDNYEELAERYAFDLLGTNYGSTESGCSIAAYVHAAKGDKGTPADLQRGATPEEVKAGAAEIGMPVVDDVPDTDYTYAGKPVDGIMEISLRDEQDEAVENDVGEICMRPERAGLIFQEYYGKADRTVEAWRNLWFHTGDAGYRDEEGNYYFVDRMGGVIRRRGENISSMQVEEIVGSHDAISQVAAFPVPAEEGGEDEVAVAITLEDGQELQEAALREYLSDRMPEFMYPKHVYFVDEMPTTGTNKVAKFELKERFQ